jgi:hypothetical protein
MTMKVKDPGRSYDLAGGNGLVFLQMENGWVVRDGTTNEEVLELLIQRITKGHTTLPCSESIRALYHLREALAALRMRAARPTSANVGGPGRPHIPAVESVKAQPVGIVSHESDVRPPLRAALAALEVCLRHPARPPS